MSDLANYLFETNAIRFCEENKPFWYTSGKIGPYFINTHFVFGSEKEASDFLAYIDECLADKMSLPEKIFKRILEQYNNNKIYHDVINYMREVIEKNIDLSTVDYISGGERRDWFFSNIISYLLHKPHLTIYKDLSIVCSDINFTSTKTINDLGEKNVLHIADLVTVASSYIRTWIPAIKGINGIMKYSCVVVDRMQGGKEKIEAEGVKFYSLINVDNSLFEIAYKKGIINKNQLDMLKGFFKNPDETMKQFLVNHPEFLENSLNSDEKTRKRAKLLVDGNLYGLN